MAIDKDLVPVPSFLNYFVNRLGDVWSSVTNKYLKQQIDKRGYMVVKLYSKNRTVHRLVAETFLGDVRGFTVNHKNGIKSDNRLGNLEICSNKDNMSHAYKYGIRYNHSGERAGNAKLNNLEVELIKSHIGIISNVDLGLMFGVHKSTISKIKNNVNWSRHGD